MNKKTFAYVGTWTVQTSENGGGIGIYEYHEIDGSLTYRKNVRPDITAGMMCVDQERGILYAVDERTDSEEFFYEGGGGRVLAFSINPETRSSGKNSRHSDFFRRIFPRMGAENG